MSQPTRGDTVCCEHGRDDVPHGLHAGVGALHLSESFCALTNPILIRARRELSANAAVQDNPGDVLERHVHRGDVQALEVCEHDLPRPGHQGPDLIEQTALHTEVLVLNPLSVLGEGQVIDLGPRPATQEAHPGDRQRGRG